MSRPSWSGFLRFSLISVPVKGYNVTISGSDKTGFHLLHTTCHSRIQYKKVCPIHGEVKNDEIVSGYEVSKGKYVTVDAEEKKDLKTEDEKTIALDTFVLADSVDPIYYTGRSYYLVPDGKVAQKPYSVLLEAMRDAKRQALGQVVFAGHVQIALIRPSEGVLSMSLLSFENQVKKPSDFNDEISTTSISSEERKLAETLIEAATAESLELGHYKDEYQGKLTKLIEGKSRKKKTVGSAESESPGVINLMDALRQSLDRTKKSNAKTERGTPKTTTRPARRRKTG